MQEFLSIMPSSLTCKSPSNLSPVLVSKELLDHASSAVQMC